MQNYTTQSQRSELEETIPLFYKWRHKTKEMVI